MKSVFTFAVVLLLVMVASDVAFSREQPYNFVDPRRGQGDDHTWGGEQQWDGGISMSAGYGSFVPLRPNLVYLDILFNTVFESWIYDPGAIRTEGRVTHFYIIPTGGDHEGDPDPSDNNKGNTR